MYCVEIIIVDEIVESLFVDFNGKMYILVCVYCNIYYYLLLFLNY